MEASELRINNIVKYTSSLSKAGIKTISASDIVDCQNYPEDYHPIPLTEEWLLRFGAIQTPRIKKSLAIRINGELAIEYSYGIISITCAQVDINMQMNCTAENMEQIKYVHQLQNLYFALTHEELKINELTT